MREIELIQKILGNFKRSSVQVNHPFSCDAEIVAIADQMWAISIDDFSPHEDMFGDLPPENIGRNIATATLSDLFACGAKPAFFLHSLVTGQNDSDEFIDGLTKGISSILDKTGCFLLGGDIGSGGLWRYTGVAIGKVDNENYLSRLIPEAPQDIWVTGTLGDANLAAFTQKPAPLFELRTNEAAYIRKCATACIDTSGGLIDSLWILKQMNQNMRFDINTDQIPLDPQCVKFCKDNKIPPLAFLMGGAGEYELLFATTAGTIPNIEATQIGKAAPSDSSGLYLSINGRNPRQLIAPPADPRAFNNRDLYIQEILTQANKQVQP